MPQAPCRGIHRCRSCVVLARLLASEPQRAKPLVERTQTKEEERFLGLPVKAGLHCGWSVPFAGQHSIHTLVSRATGHTLWFREGAFHQLWPLKHGTGQFAAQRQSQRRSQASSCAFVAASARTDRQGRLRAGSGHAARRRSRPAARRRSSRKGARSSPWCAALVALKLQHLWSWPK